MAGVRFTELQSRPMEFLDFTSLTLDEFHQLVPPFEAAFHAHMAVWRMDGKPWTARRFTVYKSCPYGKNIRTCLSSSVYLLTQLEGSHGKYDHGLLGLMTAKPSSMAVSHSVWSEHTKWSIMP